MHVQKLNKNKQLALIPFLLLITISLTASICLNAYNAGGNQAEINNKSIEPALPKVLSVESFLTDITKNVSGNRLKIDTLIPLGLDTHSFEPSPGDVAKITESDILSTNGAGLEKWLDDIITSANEKIMIVECSKGLKGDPHFWLDPNLVKVIWITWAQYLRLTK